MISGYSADQFQAFAIDVWDGDELNARIFLANSHITFPYLMYGGINGIMVDYNCSYDIVFVIGGDGIIIYRGEYANPFNPQTRIPYELGSSAAAERVTLQILDLRGRVVMTLVDGMQAGGQRYEATWNGTDGSGRRMPSGAYMSRLTVGNQSQAKLLTLVK